MLAYFFIGIALYFIPTITAYSNKKRNKGAVFALNFFLGWTIIGWIVSLVWAITKDAEPTVVIEKHHSAPQRSASSELVELHALKEKGAITDEEFQSQKKKILGM